MEWKSLVSLSLWQSKTANIVTVYRSAAYYFVWNFLHLPQWSCDWCCVLQMGPSKMCHMVLAGYARPLAQYWLDRHTASMINPSTQLAPFTLPNCCCHPTFFTASDGTHARVSQQIHRLCQSICMRYVATVCRNMNVQVKGHKFTPFSSYMLYSIS